MCISPPPPIQFSPINYTTIEGNFLIQPLQTMKRTSLKEVLLFEVVIEAAKAAATNRGPWSVWISKRAAPQNKKDYNNFIERHSNYTDVKIHFIKHITDAFPLVYVY